jgi:predicted  nucleic acid-binding Zn-ribbon protein
LRPLKSKISKAEAEIQKLEHQYEANNQAIINAPSQGKGSEVSNLAKENRELEDRIHELYDRLDYLTKDYELKEKKFQNHLEQL